MLLPAGGLLLTNHYPVQNLLLVMDEAAVPVPGTGQGNPHIKGNVAFLDQQHPVSQSYGLTHIMGDQDYREALIQP
ncbi:hypothetical protein D3C87_2040030 [compost metagenome]